MSKNTIAHCLNKVEYSTKIETKAEQTELRECIFVSMFLCMYVSLYLCIYYIRLTFNAALCLVLLQSFVSDAFRPIRTTNPMLL